MFFVVDVKKYITRLCCCHFVLYTRRVCFLCCSFTTTSFHHKASFDKYSSHSSSFVLFSPAPLGCRRRSTVNTLSFSFRVHLFCTCPLITLTIHIPWLDLSEAETPVVLLARPESFPTKSTTSASEARRASRRLLQSSLSQDIRTLSATSQPSPECEANDLARDRSPSLALDQFRSPAAVSKAIDRLVHTTVSPSARPNRPTRRTTRHHQSSDTPCTTPTTNQSSPQSHPLPAQSQNLNVKTGSQTSTTTCLVPQNFRQLRRCTRCFLH